jgi:acyl carrier protein
MDINSFVTNFAGIFDDTDASLITATTKFRDLEEWNSLVALSLISMVDDEYDIKLKGEDIRSSNTVEDIYNKVVANKA